jgi:hypothetical protein
VTVTAEEIEMAQQAFALLEVPAHSADAVLRSTARRARAALEVTLSSLFDQAAAGDVPRMPA